MKRLLIGLIATFFLSAPTAFADIGTPINLFTSNPSVLSGVNKTVTGTTTTAVNPGDSVFVFGGTTNNGTGVLTIIGGQQATCSTSYNNFATVGSYYECWVLASTGLPVGSTITMTFANTNGAEQFSAVSVSGISPNGADIDLPSITPGSASSNPTAGPTATLATSTELVFEFLGGTGSNTVTSWGTTNTGANFNPIPNTSSLPTIFSYWGYATTTSTAAVSSSVTINNASNFWTDKLNTFRAADNVANGTLVKTIILNTSAGQGLKTWTVPSDWNSAANVIEVLGAGGDGGHALGGAQSTAAGGGGAYAQIANLVLTPGASVNYAIGADATDTSTGTATSSTLGMENETFFNASSYASSTASVSAAPGHPGVGITAGAGGSVSNSTGTTTYAGGAGGGGSVSNFGGAGGGGAAGPGGPGQSGSLANSGAGNGSAGGGAENNLAALGNNIRVGGNGIDLSGGAVANVNGFNGGGGGPGNTSAQLESGANGGCDNYMDGQFVGPCGGGGGAAGNVTNGGSGGGGGAYGGGGGAGGGGPFGFGGRGGQGVIVIIYKPVVAGVKTVALVSGTSWSVPSDFTSTNIVECIGAGGQGSKAVNSGLASTTGSGGGGGLYSRIENISLVGSITYAIGGASSQADTYFNGAASTTASLSCAPGMNAVTSTNGNGGTATTSTGTYRFRGGQGGTGQATTAANARGGNGGGGSGARFGQGVFATTNPAAGVGASGGGSAGGGAVGAQASTNNGGNGGNDISNANGGVGGLTGSHNGSNGGAALGLPGAGGGGGFGTTATPGTGGNGASGEEFDSTHGAGGGGGGSAGSAVSAAATNNAGAGGTYGGGGGGSGELTGGGGAVIGNQGAGGQGIIFITYVPLSTSGSAKHTSKGGYILIKGGYVKLQ